MREEFKYSNKRSSQLMQVVLKMDNVKGNSKDEMIKVLTGMRVLE